MSAYKTETEREREVALCLRRDLEGIIAGGPRDAVAMAFPQPHFNDALEKLR